MRNLLAVVLAVFLWLGTAIAPAMAGVAGLTPCGDNPAFQARAAEASTDAAQNRFDRYSEALCGEDGLPHLIVDGRWSHAGDFTIPSILFLYITGWIGWVGRSYIQAIKKAGNAEEKEIIIDIPLALQLVSTGFAWPLLAFKEYTSGEMFAKDNEIPVSPR
jgi:photosystem I subunit 3